MDESVVREIYQPIVRPCYLPETGESKVAVYTIHTGVVDGPNGLIRFGQVNDSDQNGAVASIQRGE